MLDPNERTLLFDALRPPDGYRMDEAIGTSFSLDLVALLAAPLGFTLAEWRGNPRDPWSIGDSLAILRTLRRYAGRMSIFCDAARIKVPKEHSRLFTLLEEAVVPVCAPQPGAAFHPKTWILRFAPADGAEAPVRYRLVVATRNLTFDRCMDVVAVLEGDYRERVNGISSSKSIATFVRKLPEIARIPINDAVQARIDRVAHEVHRTQFNATAPFTEQDFVFYSLGLGERARPEFDNGARERLVIAPFLSDSQLKVLTLDDASCTLISRGDEIAKLSPKTRARFKHVLVPRRELLEMEQDGDNEGQSTLPVSDLHAKIYIEEIDTRTSRVTVGSANATHAAFHSNVEVLLALIGPTSKVGVNALLNRLGGNNDFAELWEPYVDTLQPEEDSALAEMTAQLEAARVVLAANRWMVLTSDGAAAGLYRCELRAEDPLDDSALHETHVRAWPVTVRENRSVQLVGGCFEVLQDLTVGAVSAFWIIELSLRGAGAPPPVRFVIRARLEGEPPHRIEAVTESLLANRSALMRYLQLLLADDDADLLLGSDKRLARKEDCQGDAGDSDLAPWALLEPLLRALERDPKRLDDIERVLADLRATDEGRAKLPPELDQVWPAVWSAREQLSS